MAWQTLFHERKITVFVCVYYNNVLFSLSSQGRLIKYNVPLLRTKLPIESNNNVGITRHNNPERSLHTF